MALECASRNCFTAFDAALEAVDKNDASGAAIILQSVQKDGEIFRSEARCLHEQLRRVEKQQETRVEDITREINNLYQEEQKLKQEDKNLQAKIISLQANKEHHDQSRNEAQRRYDSARAKQREAERRLDEVRTWWWVPIYGQILVVREIIEDNAERANDAERDKNRHERDVQDADREISSTNTNILQVLQRINNIQEEVNNLERERKRSHYKLGESKKMTVVALEALSFAEELINLTGEASQKTGYLQRIMALAAKRNINIQQSRGMGTAVNSFEDAWMRIVEKMSSNQIIILNENRLTL